MPAQDTVEAAVLTAGIPARCGSARGFQGDLRDIGGQQTRGRLNLQPSGLIFMHRSPARRMLAHAADRVERCGHGKDFSHATRSAGNRELRQPRTRAAGKGPSRRAT